MASCSRGLAGPESRTEEIGHLLAEVEVTVVPRPHLLSRVYIYQVSTKSRVTNFIIFLKNPCPFKDFINLTSNSSMKFFKKKLWERVL